MNQPPHDLEPYKNRIIWTFFALVFAILWMTLGFWRAVGVAVIVLIGYLIGAYLDGDLDLRSWFDFFSN